MEAISGVKLRIEDIGLTFGGTESLAGVSASLSGKEILAVIGPNGAGKTCLLNCISGFYRPQKGSIHFEDENITRLSPHKIAKLGIARTFQNIELYTGMSTLDNLMAGRHIHFKSGLVSGALYFGKAHKDEIIHRQTVEEIIEFLEIEAVRKTVVGALPYGIRKRIELGRALALGPEILLLDEPMAGMNVEEKEDMARFILDIQEDKGIPIILVEHDMGLVMDIADRVVVLDFGLKIAEGSPDEIKVNDKVIKAYLGQTT